MRVLWVQTSNSGVAYWRLFNFWKAAHRGAVFNSQVLWWQKDLNEPHPWQYKLLDDRDPLARSHITGGMGAAAQNADIIVFQVVHTAGALSMFYAVRDMLPNVPVLVECDDNLVSVPTYSPAHDSYNPQTEPTKLALAQIQAADGMIVSTPHLKEVYSEFCDNIWVIPNCIDFSDWDKVKKKRKPGVRVGWAGGATHDKDLELVLPVIDKLLKKHDDLSFVFVHGVPDSLKNRKGVEWVRKWARIDRYPQHLANQDFDIGIAPLVDNSFNRGKSNLRWLEYSALGIPTVASDVGHFNETIMGGLDGLLAADWAEFYHNLDRLICDRRLRRKIGKEARARVARDFNVDTVILKYKSALEEAVKLGAKPPEQPADIYQDEVTTIQ